MRDLSKKKNVQTIEYLHKIVETVYSYLKHQLSKIKMTELTNLLILINSMRIGHTRLPHGHPMNNEDPITCTRYNEILSIKYVITDCQNEVPRKNQI